MKPFDLEAAKAGAPVCTRKGLNARILCFDAQNNDYPIIALITNEVGGEFPTSYTETGRRLCTAETEFDLFMVDEEHFDIKELKPFDKVLVRDRNSHTWKIGLYAYYSENTDCAVVYKCQKWCQCIPYNEKTAHLVDTREMPPAKYIR